MTTRTFRLPGRAAESKPSSERLCGLLEVEVVHETAPIVLVRGGPSDEHDFADARDDDVVEIEHENGIRRWVSVAQYRDELRAEGRVEGNVARVPATVGTRSAERGPVQWLRKGIRFLRLGADPDELGKAAAELGRLGIIHALEDRMTPPPGLYRAEHPRRLAPIEPDLNAGEGPFLLFLHGTASSTAGSFGGFAEDTESDEWKELRRRYRDRVLAFQHRTLSESPITNALALVKQLPRGARLHLVSHSRGGLIGELLCAAGLPAGEVQQYRRAGDAFPDAAARDTLDRDLLTQLLAELAARELRIERFVRVGCPARGTHLASARLDRYLSVILNAIGWIPGVSGNPAFEFTRALILTLVSKRANAWELPGLEAQMTESPLVRLLNDSRHETDADLAVVAGDMEGEGLGRKVLELLTDAYYREDHDLVVHTRSMYGGLKRKSGAWFTFDTGRTVDHFHYFRNLRTRRRLQTWLLRDDAIAEANPPRGFARLTEARRTAVRSRGPDGDLSGMPVVFVLPGIMGSTLSLRDEPVWVEKRKLMGGGFESIGFGREGVQAAGLVDQAYADIVAFLARSHHVLPFAYDWRLSIAGAADRLAGEVRRVLDRTQEPVRFLAHSMGGLVVRRMIREHSGLWDQVCGRDGGRLVMLGTPNHGSWSIARMLAGHDELTRMLARWDFSHSHQELLAYMVQFPGVLELLPSGEPALSDPAFWPALLDEGRCPHPRLEDLERARAVRASLSDEIPHAERVLLVAGSATSTPCGVDVDGRGKVTFMSTTGGDGRVTDASAALPGVKTWFAKASHGELPMERDLFPAIRELLLNGSTGRLPTKREATRGIGRPIPMPPDPEGVYPDETDVVAAALGFVPVLPGARAAKRLEVVVRHTHLRIARFPIVVGHHVGDPIVSAEAVIDHELDGQLRYRHQLGMYAGPIGSLEIVHARPGQGRRLSGAIIIGLGPVGELRARELSESVMTACLRYALELAREEDALTELGLSSLLVGAGFGSRLTIEESVGAIVQGVLYANRRLDDRDGGVRFRTLEFVELFEDQAIDAARVVARISDRLHLLPGEEIEAGERLAEHSSGRRRVTLSENSAAWWRRIKVTRVEDAFDEIQYEILTSRAAAATRTQAIQWKLIDRLIQDAIRTSLDDPTMSRTLFSLLLPPDLKLEASFEGNLAILVDETTANFPWELLRDRTEPGHEPLAVRCALTRQLASPRPVAPGVAGSGRRALVIGDPGQVEEKLRLKGAEEEAKSVERLLAQAGYDVNPVIGQPALATFRHLFAESYAVLHIAAHGASSFIEGPEMRRMNGVVLGDGLFLSASEMSTLLPFPSLVFLNCCHLGEIDVPPEGSRFNEMAAGIARELIEGGVRCVVAAGWAVDDAAAKTFAVAFYEAFLRGAEFGNAVRAARKAAYEGHPSSNTWGAYQCYGDPGFRLVDDDTFLSAQADDRPVSRRELIHRLETVGQRARDADDQRKGKLAAEIEALELLLGGVWDRSAEVRSAFGSAWAEIAEFERAIEHYESALEDSDSTAPIRTVEQLANLRSRAAIALASAGPWTAELKKKTQAWLEAAKTEIESLIAIRPTPERWAILGSLMRRWLRWEDAFAAAKNATVPPARAAKYVKAACDAYKQAHDLATRDPDGDFDPYPALVWLGCSTILEGKAPDDLEAWLDRSCRSARRRDAVSPSVWNRAALADAEVLRAIALDQEIDIDGIAGKFAQARLDASPRELLSMVDNLDFLIVAFRLPRPGKKQVTPKSRARVAMLERLRERVASSARGGPTETK